MTAKVQEQEKVPMRDAIFVQFINYDILDKYKYGHVNLTMKMFKHSATPIT